MQRGFCNHPAKKSRIVTEWKCVDIQFPSEISNEERNRRQKECRKRDWFGVCDLCKYFTPDAGTEAVKASGIDPATTQVLSPEPEEKPAYTEPISPDDEMYM
jgi:hypothetical protein